MPPSFEPPSRAASAEIRLPFRIGTRTLATLRLRLARHRLTLSEALSGALPALPPLAPIDHGYLVTGLPAASLAALRARHPGFRPFVRQAYRRNYATLGGSFDDYLAGFSAKSRSTLKRKVKRLRERSGGALDLSCHRTPDEMAAFYSEARAVSERTYQERLLDAGLPAGAEALAGMRALAARDAVRGWLLHLDGRAIAYLYAPAEDGALLYAHLGYDPDFAEYSPGAVLQIEAMRQLFEEKRFALFDFTEGDSQNKRQFATDGIDCVDVLLARPRLATLAAGHALGAFDGAVAAAKRVLGGLGGRTAQRGLSR